MNTLADAGYFIALFNPKDHHHARCKAFFPGYVGQTTKGDAESLAMVPGQPGYGALHRAFMRVRRRQGGCCGPAAAMRVFLAAATDAGVVTSHF